MLRIFLVIISGMTLSMIASAQSVYMTNTGKVTFYSKAPLEDIEATSNKANCIVNTSNGEVLSIIAIRTFKFAKALMEEHFNEKYVESEKFPKSTFKGTINEAINWSRDTVANITATGVMDLHGVNKMITESGKLTIKNGVVTIDFVFNVALKDYNIEVPKVVTQSVAEVIKITGSFTYKPYIKKQ